MGGHNGGESLLIGCKEVVVSSFPTTWTRRGSTHKNTSDKPRGIRYPEWGLERASRLEAWFASRFYPTRDTVLNPDMTER